MESILIVDDDTSIRMVLREELEEVGYTAMAVDSADAALNFIDNNNPIDLILLDLKMPIKDGFYFLEELGRRKKNIKVIVLTGYADIASAIKSAKLGAADFITKPYDLDELIVSIRKVLHM